MTQSGGPQPDDDPLRATYHIVLTQRVRENFFQVKGVVENDVGRRMTNSEFVQRLIDHWEET